MAGWKWVMGFESRIRLEVIADDQWRVVEPIRYQYQAILIEIPAGFETDLASVPRLPFMYMLFGGRGTAASVIHDYLYRTGIVDRSTADAIFREVMGETGVPWYTRLPMYWAVRLGGGSSYKKPLGGGQ